MLKRLLKIVLFPLVIVLGVIQVSYELIRWLITGKEWQDPWFLNFYFK